MRLAGGRGTRLEEWHVPGAVRADLDWAGKPAAVGKPIAKGAVREKNNATSMVIAALTWTGMLCQPKTGSTRKKAETRVNTIAKPRSCPVIRSINQRPTFWMQANISVKNLSIT